MKKLLTALCTVGTIGIAALAHAEDHTAAANKDAVGTHSVTKTEKKMKTKGEDGTATKTEDVKTEVSPTDHGGSTKSIEKTVKSKAPGAKEQTTKTKETVTKDAKGHVLSDDKKTE